MNHHIDHEKPFASSAESISATGINFTNVRTAYRRTKVTSWNATLWRLWPRGEVRPSAFIRERRI